MHEKGSVVQEKTQNFKISEKATAINEMQPNEELKQGTGIESKEK